MAPTIEISNILKLNKQDSNVDSVIKQFTYPNPRFYENLRLGFSNFGTPRNICLAGDTGNDHLILPRGLIKELFLKIPDMEIVDKTVTNSVHYSPSNIILRDYQQEPVKQMLKRNQGIIVSPPGSGKTVMGIEVVVKRSNKSLLLVHTTDLAEQLYEQFKTFTDIIPGIINARRFEVRDVTIGMVQSLNKPLEESFVKQFGLIMLDEAHHAPAFTFQNLINQFPARFRYGLTATPERADGLTFILRGVMGPVLHEIKRDLLFLNGSILKPKIKAIHTNFYIPDCRDYGQLLSKIIQDNERNALILNYIHNEASQGHYCLILSERINHVRSLHKAFSALWPEIKAVCLTSKNSKTERSLAIRAMNQGEINVLFATKLADEGLDIRRLDRLFLTCPIRSTNKVKQQTGRILRTFPGKEDAVVYDFLDSLCSLANSQFYTRKNGAYVGYEIEEIQYNKEINFGNTDSKETV